LQPLEDAIANFLLPALVDHKCSQLEARARVFKRQLKQALPVKEGGIGLEN
jgi:hypothetical protein